jgi:hypothetical protein
MDSNEKNTAIAKAMGYRVVEGTEIFPFAGGRHFNLLRPNGSPVIVRARTEGYAWSHVPAFHCVADYSREMVQWLAGQPISRWKAFVDGLFEQSTQFTPWYLLVAEIMTVPLPKLRDAAFAAIKEIERAEKQQGGL